MTEKKKSRNFIATDEEWEMIKAAAGERHQSSSEFLISVASKEAHGAQNTDREIIIKMARLVHIMADKVLENADPKWVDEIIYEAKELYPLPDKNDHGESDG